MTIGPHCPIDLDRRFWDPSDTYVLQIGEVIIDKDGYEQTERINGFTQCPKCHLWWPNIEEPCEWEEGDCGEFNAVDWWGGAMCWECDLLMVEQPDGRGEVYQL